jgi:vesicle coat complex subunit
VQEDLTSNLSRISQLTGFSDPIYAEAYVLAILQFRSMWTVFEWENRVNVDNQMSYVVFMQTFI